MIYVLILLLHLQKEIRGAQASYCCRRVPNTFNIGYDLSGQPVHLDVGRCSVECESLPATETPYVSVLERIKGRQGSSQTCKSNDDTRGRSTCEPSRTHVETITFNYGPKFFDVIDECVCRKSPKRCERIRKLKTFFAGTKYEATVDVGECMGRCKGEKNGKQCRSTRTKPHPVMGPNGMMSVETVAECRCETSCYRQQFNVALTEQKEDNNGSKTLATKVVDVGRCIGTCSPIEHCVVRSSNRKDGKCLMSLETTDVTCVPLRVHDVTYFDRHGNERRIAQIRRCGCT